MTINVVCRRDAINRNRLAPLALVFTHDRRRKFVGLGISEALVHWDFDKQQPTADCPDRAEIQFQITSKIREYEKKIKKLEVLEIPVTFDTLFEQNGKRINCTVGEYFKQIIERLEKVEKYSSASKHKVTLVLVSQFRSVNMRFDELDLTYLREFEIFLSQKGNVNNSCNYAAFQYCRLYLIEILHQTTTHCKCIQFTLCCILSKFYIKPQLRTEATEQHKRDLLLASQGDFKEAPTVGVDCVSFLHDIDPADFLRTVRKQCERDGMRVDAVDYATDGTLTISAEYDDSNS